MLSRLDKCHSDAKLRNISLLALTLIAALAVLGAPALFQSHVSPGILLSSLVLLSGLGVLSAIDFYAYRLPDALTLPLMVAGVAFSAWRGAEPLWWPFASAAVGFALLAGLGKAYHYVRGRHGLGLGDAKLFAASGAWLGAEALPLVLLWATGAALVWVAASSRKHPALTGTTRIPFGPFLALGTWLVWSYGSH